MDCFRPSFSESPIPLRIAFFAIVSTGPEWAVIRAIKSFTVFSSCASGTNLFMSPISNARSAVTGSPVRTSSKAVFGPTRYGKIVEASGGKTPIEISGCANLALGVAITKSPNAASSAPPPIAGPFTTQITGFAVSKIPENAE